MLWIEGNDPATTPTAAGCRELVEVIMKTHRLLVVLTLVNLALLVAILWRGRPVVAQETPAVLRGRALEIVDEQGRLRSSITVVPATTVAGKAYPETILLRLITPDGTPVVKLGASVQGAGLSLLGDSDRTQALIGAEGAEAIVTLTNRDGRQQLVRPQR